MCAEPVVVLYASISVLSWMRAATGSQCKDTKRGVTCSFGLVEDQSSMHTNAFFLSTVYIKTYAFLNLLFTRKLAKHVF